jgi:hypothetical protein
MYVTASAKPVATAASTALPPASKISSATFAAYWSETAIAACRVEFESEQAERKQAITNVKTQ